MRKAALPPGTTLAKACESKWRPAPRPSPPYTTPRTICKGRLALENEPDPRQNEAELFFIFRGDIQLIDGDRNHAFDIGSQGIGGNFLFAVLVSWRLIAHSFEHPFVDGEGQLHRSGLLKGHRPQSEVDNEFHVLGGVRPNFER